jgi:hypothetical protein
MVIYIEIPESWKALANQWVAVISGRKATVETETLGKIKTSIDSRHCNWRSRFRFLHFHWKAGNRKAVPTNK